MAYYAPNLLVPVLIPGRYMNDFETVSLPFENNTAAVVYQELDPERRWVLTWGSSSPEVG